MKTSSASPRPRGRRASNRDLDRRIGALLRERRIALGLSQSVLGEKLGITFQQIQKYENGSNQLSVARLLQICDALEVGTAYFLDNVHIPAHFRRQDYEVIRAVAAITDPAVRGALVRLARCFGPPEASRGPAGISVRA